MYKLSIVTTERIVYEDNVTSIIAPGSVGYLGILTDHAPIITSLKPGKLTVRDASGKEIIFAVSGGFLENSANNCSILADAAEFASDIDLERARSALERARQRIRDAAGNIEVDISRARSSYERAKARIDVRKGKR
jgi:F-type H+-transporting ATPase subunit epsilon